MNIVVYAQEKQVRDEFLQNCDAKQTVIADTPLLLEYLRDNSFSLFLAHLNTIQELPLRSIGHIYRILATEG